MEQKFAGIHVQVVAPIDSPSHQEILTADALRFVGFLCAKFEDRRQTLLKNRELRATEFDSGINPSFLKASQASLDPHWRCAPIPQNVQDRRVEITGPVDRKMVINGLNSGANVYMADFEDSTSPAWNNMVEGQHNLRDAVRGTISYVNPKNGKAYRLKEQHAVLFVRPRGWHLDEAHVLVNGRAASGSLFDFGLYLFHNVNQLSLRGTGPYYYIPKLENHLEARLWNDVFVAAQKYLAIPVGTIRATALLETITAAFEMEEILYELKDHSLGLNCGRWDYLFSFIKKFKCHQDRITPDRSYLTMTTPLMEAYVKRLIHICHKRGTFAMGGMSAAIPIKNDPEANAKAMEKIKADKIREVMAGHDGTWVAHPALVAVAKDVFDHYMPNSNQIETARGLSGKHVTEEDLLRLPSIHPNDAVTSAHLKSGISIVLAYTEAWLRGIGCIPLNNAMEDAATAEISRAQIWQWRYHGVVTSDDGQIVSKNRIQMLIQDVITSKDSSTGKWKLAGKLVEDMMNGEKLDQFLTSVCYPHIVSYATRGGESGSSARL
mmetsp:Transcript_31252/g.47842  ORF Transcript_31252/g.47842 Transcript_31252/m.47842 type:complete len:549 (-) Transcript_31252:288-1934(-)